MDHDNDDLCLNISYSTPESGESSRAKRRGNKRKAASYDQTHKPTFVSQKRSAQKNKFAAKSSFQTTSATNDQDAVSSVRSTRPAAERVARDSEGGNPTSAKRSTVKRPNARTNAVHVRGLGLPRADVAVETVAFNEEDAQHSRKNTKPSGVTSSLFGNNPEIPLFASRAVKPVSESVFSAGFFKDLPIHPYMVSNLEQNLHLTKLTTVQAKTIPALLSGCDALVRSQTGTGKTLAYALPIVEALQKIVPKLARSAGVQAVVVVPTRELALQTYELFIKLVKPFTWLVPGYLVGGEKRKSEKARLRRGITVLVGTPGRLVDHVNNTEVMKIDRVKWLVLDEADRLLDLGYEKDVSSLVSAIDAAGSGVARQTVLVSATLTSAVQRLAGLTLKQPTHVDAADGATDADTDDLSIPETLAQYYVATPAKLRLVTLVGFIKQKCTVDSVSSRKMLVFMATQDMVDYHMALLLLLLDCLQDVKLFKLHGNMTQAERTECFRTFRAAPSGVLLCTDVGARGLDVPHVDWIVQYTAPCTAQDYVHRVGRTARAGAAGCALLFLATTELEFVRSLEQRRIRLQELRMDTCLQALAEHTQDVNAVQGAATALQLRMETAVLEQEGLHDAACRAFTSFVRFYASYPKEGRAIFSFKNLHLGHHAKSFALRDAPTSISGIGRRRWEDDAHSRPARKQYTTSGPNKGRSLKTSGGGEGGVSRAKSLIISEYSSGLPQRKKQKTTPRGEGV